MTYTATRYVQNATDRPANKVTLDDMGKLDR